MAPPPRRRRRPFGPTAVYDGDICVTGMRLVDDGSQQDIDPDDAVDIMIHPD